MRTSTSNRLLAGLTLVSFVTTTVLPSLTWAAPSEDRRWTKEELTPEQAQSSDRIRLEDAPAPKKDKPEAELIDKDLANPGQLSTRKPRARVPVEQDAKPSAPVQEETVAKELPTGGGDKSGVTSQAISMPKGSGTIQGMGESFSAQLSTGIATFSVPFALPAARGGAQPSLGLSYSSASGAGLAGVGWSVGVPYIARQTDRGLPGYDDRGTWHENQDRFVFNGGQELVPICTVDDALHCLGVPSDETMPAWSAGAQYFRARVEGSFLRFFWLPNHLTWRVQDKSGVSMELGIPLGGPNANSRDSLEVDPSNETRVFRWHLVRQYDSYGAVNAAGQSPAPVNVVVYGYQQDGGQAYLRDIYDTPPVAEPTTTDVSRFAHHARLEYEARTDPSESYRSGWLIEQGLRLKRLDVASKPFDGESGARHLVRRYHLTYDSLFHTSYLESVQVEGRCEGAESNAPAESNEAIGQTSCSRLPPMAFEYKHVAGFNPAGHEVPSSLPGYEAFDGRIRQVQSSPPHSIDEALSDYVDINADGLPDVLVTAPGIYGNDFGVFLNSDRGVVDSFGAVLQQRVNGVAGANSGSLKLSNPNVALLDIDSDGIVDVLHMPKVKTYSVYSSQLRSGQWTLVGRPIDSADGLSPKVDLGRDAAETRLMDVNFDGMVDVVVSTGTEFQTFFALGRLPGGDAQFGHGSWASATTGALSSDPVSKCVPYSGTPVRFSDSDIQLADMNGDGIQDIVRLRRGDIRYWPGRGNGFWGTGELEDCPAGTFGDKRTLTMERAPYYSDIQGSSLRMDDVNGDGLDDLVQVRFDAIDVWLNVDGHGWTARHTLDGTPTAPSFMNRVRLLDMNGSGTRDVVWGDGRKYRYLDLAGGERPGLLTRVVNGLGKSTDIEYSTSTAEMLSAERSGVACEAAGAPFERAWCSKMPTVTHVVKRVVESDNLSVAGAGAGKYITEYSYRDPVYEGRQREFRGFARARSKRVGDANSPSDFTDSTFLLGECDDETTDGVDDCAVSERWRDNPKEALKGLPIITERYDENGRYLSTDATTYRLRQLYLGLDGRHVRHAFESRKRTTVYDSALPTVASGTDSVSAVVELELSPPLPVANLDQVNCSLAGLPAETFSSSRSTPVPLRASGGYATTESRTYVDAFGNATIGVALGCVAGDVCPVATTGIDADELICKFTQPTQVDRWLFRTSASWVRGSVQTGIRNQVATVYSLQGAPLSMSAALQGTQQLDRFHELLSRTFAANPATQSTNGTRLLGMREYDAFGNLVRETGPTGLGRCRTVTYDESAYKQLPISETVFTGGCDVGGLTTIAGYDRGLGAVTSVSDMNDRVTYVTYDGFGRLTQLLRPTGGALPGEEVALPSIEISYSLPSPEAPRAYSVIHTRTQDGPSESSGEYLESYAYVDGMGRTRVALQEADPSAGDAASWIASGAADFDAKGAVRRKYLPVFLNASPPEFPLSAAPDAPYGRQRYDAFGRQLQTYDIDGTVTLQSRYHALATDLFDAADLSPGPHQGTFATTRSDGHGRTIEVTERVHDGGAVDLRYLRTRYLPTGEPTVLTRYRVGSQPVVRWMRYDSMGRMVLNVDAHASVNFDPDPTVDATPSATGLKTWRYAYNDAGELVGTSDARGCGENFYYDGAGRLYGEDYSPCIKEHRLYSAPNLGSTPYNVASLPSPNGIEVFYQFDGSPTAPVAAPTSTDEYTSGNLKGRLAAVHDRAASTWFAYDARGRGIGTWRKVSIFGKVVNDAPAYSPTISSRYTSQWFHQKRGYDAADRTVLETSGATSAELLASDGTSAVRAAYTKRGTLKSVGSSYTDLASAEPNKLISSIARGADGLVGEIVFGDAAGTTTTLKYDGRRRLASAMTSRGTPGQWSMSPPDYSPAPTPDAAAPTTFQLLLQDLDYSYDVVGNPTEIRDWRTAEDWPAGAKPVSRRFEYDDLNRLTRVDYSYPGGTDRWTSPFAAELAGTTDPRRTAPLPHQAPAARPQWQTYRYDWLGNVSQSDDDRHIYFDRSVGNITHFTTTDPKTSRPYQLSGSTPLVVNTWHGDTITVSYTPTGELKELRARRQEDHCVGGGCYTRFNYDWDEVGRLLQARRISAGESIIMWMSYDANDERVHKYYESELNPSLAPTTTVYIFNTLEARRTSYDAANQRYVVNASSEVAYLSANGMRLARLHYEPTTKGEPKLATPSALHASNLHVMLSLPDHLGSSSLTIDHATGELVEARTYQPYGATESDYRPDRWKGFRDDYGFTGKEEDVAIGLQYFGKRYLSPYLGRWISADPLAVHRAGSADLNLYAYVKGAVLKAIDPVGLDDVTNRSEIEQAMFDQSGGQVGANHRYTPAPAPAAAPSGDGGGGGAPAADARMANGSAQGQSSNGDLPHDQGNASLGAGLAVASVVPGVGEAADAAVLADPESGGFDKTMATLSLGMNAVSGGLAPNYGAFRFELGLADGAVDLERGMSSGAQYAKSVTEGGTGRAFAGHGEYRLGSGDATIPEGTTLTTWTQGGQGISDKMGQLIESGDYQALVKQFPDRVEGATSWLPGAQVPNYTLKAPDRLNIMSNSLTVGEATPLTSLLQPDMGHMDWAACMKMRF